LNLFEIYSKIIPSEPIGHTRE